MERCRDRDGHDARERARSSHAQEYTNQAAHSGRLANRGVAHSRAFGLQAFPQKTFKFSSDQPFIEKVRDIVGNGIEIATGRLLRLRL